MIINTTTDIFKIEEEKSMYQKQYLSNVAHELKASIQVLMSTIDGILRNKVTS